MNEVHDCELISRSKVTALEKKVKELKRDLEEATSRYDELLTVANDWRYLADELKKGK